MEIIMLYTEQVWNNNTMYMDSVILSFCYSTHYSFLFGLKQNQQNLDICCLNVSQLDSMYGIYKKAWMPDIVRQNGCCVHAFKLTVTHLPYRST